MSELLTGRLAPSGTAGFPVVRPRRLRRTAGLRDMVRETSLRPADFVYPVFVTHGRDVRVPIDPMPGQAQLSIDNLIREASGSGTARHPCGAPVRPAAGQGRTRRRRV